jgi:hypothetical protein
LSGPDKRADGQKIAIGKILFGAAKEAAPMAKSSNPKRMEKRTINLDECMAYGRQLKSGLALPSPVLVAACPGTYDAITPAATAFPVVNRNWRRFGVGKLDGGSLFGIDLLKAARLPLLPQHPLPDKRGTISDYSSSLFCGFDKTNHLCVHQGHLIEIQHDLRRKSVDLRSQLAEVLRLHPSDQKEDRVFGLVTAFDPERHFLKPLAQLLHRKGRSYPA